MYSIARTILSIIDVSSAPQPKFIYDAVAYHPIFGVPAKVDQPGTAMKTNYDTPLTQLEIVNSPLNKSFINTPEWAAAYQQRRRRSFYNTDIQHQVDQKYRFRPNIQIREDRADGNEILSQGHGPGSVRPSGFYTALKQQQKGIV
jgi:hypothetical protein